MTIPCPWCGAPLGEHTSIERMECEQLYKEDSERSWLWVKPDSPSDYYPY